MTWILALATYLQSQSLGTMGSNLFIGAMPDIDGVSTLLTQYAGEVVETQSGGIAIHKPSLQIKVAGDPEDYVTPLTTITNIQNSLTLISNQALSGITFLRVRPITSLIALGQDEQLAYEFTCNFEVSYV